MRKPYVVMTTAERFNCIACMIGRSVFTALGVFIFTGVLMAILIYIGMQIASFMISVMIMFLGFSSEGAQAIMIFAGAVAFIFMLFYGVYKVSDSVG